MKKELIKIRPLSFARVYCAMMAIFGFVWGLIFAITMLFERQENYPPTLLVLVIILAPVLYAIFGFLLGAFSAWLYNKIAEKLGGIEIELK